MRRILALLVAAILPAAASTALEPLSSFSCRRPAAPDPGTQFNVEWATHLVDGVVLRPGELFSFNRAMDAGRNRFRRGKSYYAGRIVMSRGGGYCQVSTALYDAALLANLRIEERWTHSFYDKENAYVPQGLDASVSNSGGTDFRFRNTTAAPLTISARFEDGAVKIEMLGRGRRRKRWLSTGSLTVVPMTVLTKPASGLPCGATRTVSPGFDGYEVASYLNELDLAGNTRTVSLGKDRYRMIPLRAEAGSCGEVP